MHTTVIGQQSTLDGTAVPIRRNVWTTPIRILRNLAEDDVARCDWCGTDFFQHAQHALREQGYLHNEFWHTDSPWDEGEEACDRLCPDCAQYLEQNGTPEGYFYCDWCNRTMPDTHGMRYNYRMTDGEMVCVSCFQDDMLQGERGRHITSRGHDWQTGYATQYEYDRPSLMHRWAVEGEDITPIDFYNYSDLARHGFEEGRSFSIGSNEDAETMRAAVAAALAEGFSVALNQGNTPIIGPVPVEMWTRNERAQEEE